LVDFVLEVRAPGSVFRPVARIDLNSAGVGATQLNLFPYAIAPKNSDIRVTAEATGNSVEVDASFQGYLAEVIG